MLDGAAAVAVCTYILAAARLASAKDAAKKWAHVVYVCDDYIAERSRFSPMYISPKVKSELGLFGI